MRSAGLWALRAWCLAAFAAAACSDTPYREVNLDEGTRRPGAGAAAANQAPSLRFSVAAIESPRDTYSTHARFLERMGVHLGRRVELIQRRTYKEVNDLLATGRLDAALVCAGGYLDLRRRAPDAVEVLAVPLIGGRATLQSLIIVPARSPVKGLEGLAGKRFAYTDELSFSGRAYPVWLLRRGGRDPDRFFGSIIFTQSHDRSIASVAKGLVDGAAVHSRIYEHLLRDEPELARQTRVIHRSPELGGMPVVASTRMAPELRARLRDVLLGLHADPEAAAALGTLAIERFVPPAPGMFDATARIVEASR